MMASTGDSANMSARMNQSPTAQRLLEGARRLLERSGYASLTLEAIAREAGETKSLIRYHFGSKRGLLVALVDWVMHDYTRVQRGLLNDLSDGDERLHELEESLVAMMVDEPSYRHYFDLLPRLLQDPQMRGQAARLLSTWRLLTVSVLLPSSAHGIPKEVMTLASMSIALADGLALQLLADPSSVDVRQAMEIWDTCLRSHLVEPADAPGAPARDDGEGDGLRAAPEGAATLAQADTQ